MPTPQPIVKPIRFRRLLAALAAGLFGGLLLVGSASALAPAAPRQPTAIRFVDDAGQPLAGATVRVLCYPAAGAARPVSDRLVVADSAGLAPPLPANCNFVAALQLVHTQPSGKPGHGPAYQVFYASWAPGTPNDLALVPAAGDVTLDPDWVLVLFDVVAALEWSPGPGSPYVADLLAGLRQMSAYLYDLSEGRMAIGAVSVRPPAGWDAADLRFRAANDYRPSALIGGVVAARTAYTTTAGARTVYVPGEILLGRYWDGLGAADPAAGNWQQPAAYRTLAHEWGHYALFLYDEYQQTSPALGETYCTCPDLPEVGPAPGAACGGVAADLAASAMAYHYTAGELWLSGLPASCAVTDQWQVHGETDWQTLARWPSIQGLAANWLQDLPGGLTSGPALGRAGDLFGRTPGLQLHLPLATRGLPPAPPLAQAVVSVTVAAGQGTLATLNALEPQVYLLPTAGESPIYQGTPVGDRSLPGSLGTLSLLGARPGNQARVSVDRYTTAAADGARYVYPAPGGAGTPVSDGQVLEVVSDTWTASLDLTYDLEGDLLTTLTLTLVSPQALPVTPSVQLCTPLACPASPAWAANLLPSGAITWTAALTSPGGAELPHYGLVRVQAPGVGEILRWYQMAGGVGPAHIFGDAPLLDGGVMARALAPIVGPRNRLVLMPAADYGALAAPLPAGVAAIVGQPVEVDLLLPGNASGYGDHPLPAPVALTLFYSQAAVDRLGAFEEELVVLHYSRRQNQWFVVPVSGASTTLNWLGTFQVPEDGIYATGWMTGTVTAAGHARP